MPVLKREPELFPENVLALSAREYPWWVAHTQSRQDKALARFLIPLGVPFYLPSREQRTRRAGRSFVSYLPLFPGYVFFRGSEAHRRAALRSNVIVRVLEVLDQDLLTGELSQVRRLQELGADLVSYPELVAGDPVDIVEGPFEGHRGVVLRNQGRLRLLVTISMLRQTVAVEFDRHVLARARTSWADREGNRSATAF
jgi:transcription antitermination factor NusG